MKNLCGLIYYLTNIQTKFPFILFEKLQDYLQMANYILTNFCEPKYELLLNCALILLRKVLITKYYLEDPK